MQRLYVLAMKLFLLMFVLVVLAAGCAPPASLPTPTVSSIPLTVTPLSVARALASPTSTPPPSPSPLPPSPTPTRVCHTDATPMPTPTAPAEIRMELPTPLPSPRLQTTAEHGQLIDTHFYSPLVGLDMPILIYLPPGYNANSTQRYPVLYMLSGFAGDRREWINYGLCDAIETLVRGGYVPPMMLVLPEGNQSYWFNHAAVPGSDGKPWGDYIWKDVVDYVDAHYHTAADPRLRAIGGLSSGGQAAMMLALTHPEVFSIAGAHSPSTRHADGSLAIYGTQDYFNQYDPEWLFQHAPVPPSLSLWIDVADADTEWGDAVHDLHALLTSLKIPHTFVDTWHGIHDGYYWSAHVIDYVYWYASHWQEP